jgi:hypothetical protein
MKFFRITLAVIGMIGLMAIAGVGTANADSSPAGSWGWNQGWGWSWGGNGWNWVFGWGYHFQDHNGDCGQRGDQNNPWCRPIAFCGSNPNDPHDFCPRHHHCGVSTDDCDCFF